MEGLGRLYDVAAGVVPVDLAGGAQTGNRVHLKNCSGVAIVFYKEAGAAAEATTLTLKQHTAAAAGTSADLAVVDHYYLKSEATLDADEVWTKVTQAAAATVTPAVSDTQQILVIEVDASELDDGYEWVSVDTADTTTAGQIGSVLYLLRDLNVQRAPASLAQPQA